MAAPPVSRTAGAPDPSQPAGRPGAGGGGNGSGSPRPEMPGGLDLQAVGRGEASRDGSS